MFYRNLMMSVLAGGLALLLVACGGNGADSDAPVDADTGADTVTTTEADFTGTLSGAVEKEFAFNANFYCQDSGMEGFPDIFEMVATPGIEQVYVSVPFNTEAGTFLLLGTDGALDEDYQIQYRSEERVTYDIGDGEIVIENVPTAPRELFTGTLTAELADGDGDTITIDGTFEVAAASFAFDDCE